MPPRRARGLPNAHTPSGNPIEDMKRYAASHSYSGSRSGPGSKPGPDRMAQYGKASQKADIATAHAATPSGDNVSGHKAAAQAHRVAANAAGKAGFSERSSAHLQQAHAHNMNVIFHQQPSRVNAMTAGAASSRAAVAGGRAAQDYHGHFATFEAGHAAKYEAANTKAGVASTKAAASGSYTDHKAAAQAHRNAAGMANKADKVGNQITHAATAKAHEEMAKKSNVLTTRGRSGSFGTDPTTGNTQSKAQVSGPGVKTLRQKTPHEAYLDKRSPAALAEDTQTRQNANLRSQQAQRASAKANGKFGVEGAKAHEAAAASHRLASTAQRSAGNTDKAIEHSSKAGYHDISAKSEAGRAQGLGYTREAIAHGSHEYIRPGSHANVTNLGAKVTPQVPAMKGTSPMGIKPTATVGNASMARDAANVKAAKAMSQTTKANAKPSLVSHSLAAKAHMEATNAHLHAAQVARSAGNPEGAKQHEYAAASHSSRVQEHRVAAAAQSHHIQKLKKLGPGQHHGAKGQFTGTPGGAK